MGIIIDGVANPDFKPTVDDYDKAIANLQLAKTQLEWNGGCCVICGGDHYANECGFNPLLAMYYCEQLAKHGNSLHEVLHYITGSTLHMGQRQGPSAIVAPWSEVSLEDM